MSRTHYRPVPAPRQGVAIRGMGWAFQGRPAPPGTAIPEDSTHLKYADAAGLLFVRALAAALEDAHLDPRAGPLPIAFVAGGGVDQTIRLFWQDLLEGLPVSPSLFAMTQPGAPAAVAARVWDWTTPVRVWVAGPGALQSASDCAYAWLAGGSAPRAVLGGLRSRRPSRRPARNAVTPARDSLAAWAIVLERSTAR